MEIIGSVLIPPAGPFILMFRIANYYFGMIIRRPHPIGKKTTVNGEQLFWIRAVVSSAFTTGPVGSQITSIPDANAIIVME